MKSGIYSIENTIDGRLYIGYAINFNIRWQGHKDALRLNKHKNIHLQRAWNKYGENSFIFDKIEEWPEEYLHTMEHYWANLLQVHNRKYGYNIRPTHPTGNPTHSEETRKKIGRSGKGRPCPEHVRQANKNRKHTEEVRKKISEAGRNRILSDESRKRMSDAQKKVALKRGLLSEEEKRKRLRERNRTCKSVNRKFKTGRVSLSTEEKVLRRKIAHDKWRKSNPDKVKSYWQKVDTKNKEKRRLLRESKIIPDKLECYNEDGSLYKKYKTKSSALKEFGYNPDSTAQLDRVLTNGKLFLNKYWKYANTDNRITE